MKRLAVLIFLGVTLAITAMTYACVPVSQRLTSPVLCPSGTTESVVVTWSTSSGSGKTSEHSALHCIDEDGGGYEPAGVKIFFTLSAFSLAFVGVMTLALRVLYRGKPKKPKEVAA